MSTSSHTEPFVPVGCVDPSLGRLSAAYLSDELSPSEIARFEDHYFCCPACTRELILQQAVVRVVETLPRRRPGRAWIWVLPPALAAGLAGALFLVTRGPTGDSLQSGMRVVLLEPAVRGAIPEFRTAKAGEPFMLSLSVSVPTKIRVTYDIQIVDASAQVVFVASNVAPSGPIEVRIALPKGLPRPDRYSVAATEKGPEGLIGPTVHFTIDVVPVKTP